jgi:hypothetical protein
MPEIVAGRPETDPVLLSHRRELPRRGDHTRGPKPREASMSNRSHEQDAIAIVKIIAIAIVKIVMIIAIVVVIIAILIASARPLPGLRDITAALPALVDLVTAFRK